MERKPIILPYVCGVAKKTWSPFVCGGCKKSLWYQAPSPWHYRDWSLFIQHKIKCPHCGETHKRKVLILDVNDDIDYQSPIISEK